MKRVSVESTAEAYLELLAARGVDYFFGNGGTDFGRSSRPTPSASRRSSRCPKPAHGPARDHGGGDGAGYAMVTGRPQVVMVHTIAGTANATGRPDQRRALPRADALHRRPHAAHRDGMRGAANGGIHWAQESFDQGSMVREWVKWDYELRNGVRPRGGGRPRARDHPDRAAGPGLPDAAARGAGRAPGAPRVLRAARACSPARRCRRRSRSSEAPRAPRAKRAEPDGHHQRRRPRPRRRCRRWSAGRGAEHAACSRRPART